MTEEYTVVQLKRQEELTRRIQDKRAKAAKRSKSLSLVNATREVDAAQSWIRRIQGTGRTIQGPAGRRLTAVTGLREMLTFG